jgi:hypothetical protein
MEVNRGVNTASGAMSQINHYHVQCTVEGIAVDRAVESIAVSVSANEFQVGSTALSVVKCASVVSVVVGVVSVVGAVSVVSVVSVVVNIPFEPTALD